MGGGIHDSYWWLGKGGAVTIQSFDKYADNGALIVACKSLGYLSDDMFILDPTFGPGTFWNLWQPSLLNARDLHPGKAKRAGVRWTKVRKGDFTKMPDGEDVFDAVVFDPPYKLNGTPDADVDERYGVDEPATIAERHELIQAGIEECMRVLKPKGFLLIKCQDQVASGKIHWQAYTFARWAVSGLGGVMDITGKGSRGQLIDMLHIQGGRPQPMQGRMQRRSHRNYSTMVVVQKAKGA